MDIKCEGRWLVADLLQTHRVLSWSINAPGFVDARHVVWREVKNADLPSDLDPASWMKEELRREGYGNAVGLMTSRDIRRYHLSESRIEEDAASCLVTAGLSNAERVGRREGPRHRFGTINLLVRTDRRLSDAAMIEAMSVAVEARTLAVIEGQVATGTDGAPATGTGTDCVVIATPAGPPERSYAGLHTALGEAIGAAVLGAMRAAVSEWIAEYRAGGIYDVASSLAGVAD